LRTLGDPNEDPPVEPGPYFRKRLYYQIPHMVTCNYVELVDDLMAVKLDDMPDWAEALAIELRRRADEARAQLGLLGTRHDPRREHGEVEAEREADELAWAIHSSFECWDIITNPIVQVEPKPGEAEQRAKQEQLAQRAREISRAMFGEQGIELMHISYPDRFRALTAMLPSLRENPRLVELLHEPVRLMVRHLDYEQRLAKHLRDYDEAGGLGGARVALRWGLAVYASRIGDLADRWSEDSCARVNASLQPFVDWVARMKAQH
jgi:hypothetical protein